MFCTHSREFFEISIGPQPGNTAEARLLCVKDFLKRLIGLPIALVGKVCKTCFRSVAVLLAAVFVIVTFGSVSSARDLLVGRIVIVAKDIADWILLPFALILCFLRLILALLIHPDFYFNSI
ncbi:MAG: hypothetical protein KGQ49_00675 [Verrucomicrobia bacterium]|nr:hypothetical protein [Verrucomicrobiota bacterium]MBU6445895.1 hypothetical protein [Verrucomicrobiota bacterium]MDE3046730.1 hypothetical protein [Verrucomicrobiota bacterium]